jgi:MFS superfamily sulfate permease-like transporter
MATPTDTSAPLLRRGLLGLGALTTVGIGVELAVEHHWTSPSQQLAWLALGIVALALSLLVGTPSRTRVRVARGLAIAVLTSAAWGILAHVEANHDAGELDFRYADSWASLPEATRWWLAVSKTVGPSPPLAPGALPRRACAWSSPPCATRP